MWGTMNNETSKSAYMLIYERDYKTKIQLVVNTVQQKQDVIRALGFNPLSEEQEKSLVSDHTTETKEISVNSKEVS